MVILHIASIPENPYSGVYNVVPIHVLEQSKIEQAALINIANNIIEKLDCQIKYNQDFSFESLPKPFDNPDIIVFHEVYKPEYINIYKKALKKGIPYVIVPHGCLTNGAQKIKALKKHVGNLLLFNRFIKHAKIIQCLSQREYDETDFGVKKCVCSNGIYIPEKRKAIFSKEGMKLLYIGRIDVFHKGLDILLDSVNMISGFMRDNGCTLEIRGPRSKDFGLVDEKIKTYGIEDVVLLGSQIVGMEKEKKLLDADVFIQTSRFEGMPMGILEALSYGLPCIVTEGTGLGKLIEEKHAGWSTQFDKNNIVNTIKKAFEEKKVFNIYSNNAVGLARDFSWDKICAESIVLYEKVINEE